MPEFSNPMSSDSTDEEASLICSIRFMLAAELEASNQYETIMVSTDNRFVRAVLRGIVDEEKKHFGELLAILHALTPIDASLQSDGHDEAMTFRDLDVRVAYQAAARFQTAP
jgi:rubrerythrin